MLKPIKFRSQTPGRRDPNFVAFEEKVKYKSKNELLYMLFLAVEALAVRDQQDKAAKETVDSKPETIAPEVGSYEPGIGSDGNL